MHPGCHATDRENLQGGNITHEEWVQCFHFGLLLDELELEAGTKVVYAAGVKTDTVSNATRVSLGGSVTAARRTARGWAFQDLVENVLMDTVLHEAAV